MFGSKMAIFAPAHAFLVTYGLCRRAHWFVAWRLWRVGCSIDRASTYFLVVVEEVVEVALAMSKLKITKRPTG